MTTNLVRRFSVLALVVVCSFAGSVWAADKNKPQFVVGLNTFEHYSVDSGQVFHPDSVQQGFVGMTWHGVYGELWQGYSRTGSFGNETDFTVQYGHSLGHRLSLFTELLYVDVNSPVVPDVLQPTIGLSAGVKNTSITFKVKEPMQEGGGNQRWTYLELSANHRWHLSQRGWFVNGNTVLIRDVDGAFGFNPAWVLELKPTVGFTVKGVTVNLIKYRYSFVAGNNGDGRKNGGTFGTGITYTF